MDQISAFKRIKKNILGLATNHTRNLNVLTEKNGQNIGVLMRNTVKGLIAWSASRFLG